MKMLRTIHSNYFHWDRAGRNRYKFFNGESLCGSLKISLERSVLFSPGEGEFRNAEADLEGRPYSFKCLFFDQSFRGSMLLPEGEQPVAFYEEGAALFRRGLRRRIVLCRDGTALRWLDDRKNGRWSLWNGEERLLSLSSADPDAGGNVEATGLSFLQIPHRHAFALFCVYLALGPRRAPRSV